MKRVFAAIPVPPEVKLFLADEVAGVDLPGQAVPVENMHLTLRFLGSVDEPTSDRFLAALSTADLGGPFRVEVGGLGAFPGAKNASVVWMGVTRGASDLEDLAGAADEAAQMAGLPSEERPFKPHLTLRILRPRQDVRSALQSVEMPRVHWRCSSLVVYESLYRQGGLRYEPLETMELQR